MVELAKHVLQVAVEEFKKICEPKISKLKGGYFVSATLIFNSWLKDIDICVCDHNLTEHKAMQLVNDFMTKHANGADKFYLDTNEAWNYSKLIEHLRTSFESDKNFNSILSDFYGQYLKLKQTKDQFANELQLLVRKVIRICSEWKFQVDKVLKTQCAHRLWDQYFAAMGYTILKKAPQGMTFTKFQVECIVIFRTRSQKPTKATISTNTIKFQGTDAGQLAKSSNQLHRAKMKENIRAKTDIIEQQKKEMGTLKATSTQVDPPK